MGDAIPINEQPRQARRFRFRLRGLFLSMLLVAAACYALARCVLLAREKCEVRAFRIRGA